MAINSTSNLANNLTNLARTYLWNVVIPTPIGGGNSQTLMLRARSTQTPSRSVGVIEVPFQQGPKLQFPGKLTYDHSWSCSFIESTDSAILSAFYNWAQTIVNDNTNVGTFQNYVVTDIYLQLIGTDGSQYAQYRLVNCWIEKIGSVELSQESQDPIVVQVTFRFNSWEFSGSIN